MTDYNKIWVIDNGEDPDITSIGEALHEAPANRPASPPVPSSTMRPVAELRAPLPLRPQRSRRVLPRPTLHPALLLALGYLLGPLGLVLTARGRKSGIWAGLTTMWVVSSAVMGLGWWSVATGRGPAALLPLLCLGTVVLVMAGFSIWSHSLHMLVTAQRFPGRAWPAWLQNPWTALAAGLFAPGSALVLARRTRAAVAVAWSGWIAVAAVLLAAGSPLVWQNRHVFGNWGLDPQRLEMVILATVIVALLAPLAWLTQSLVGARVMARRQGRWQNGHGDWYAVALCLTLVVCGVTSVPHHVARELGYGADILSADESRIMSLGLATAARQLDPGQPAYARQVIALQEAPAIADDVRDPRLEEDLDLRTLVGAMIRGGGTATDDTVRARAIQVRTSDRNSRAAPRSVPTESDAVDPRPVLAKAASLFFMPGQVSHAATAPPPAPAAADSMP